AAPPPLPAEEPPDDDEEEEDEDDAAPALVCGPPALKGSLLSKSENDWSWPTPAGGWTAAISGADWLVAVVLVAGDALGTGTVGTAAVVVAGAGSAVVAVASCGREEAEPPFRSDIIV